MTPERVADILSTVNAAVVGISLACACHEGAVIIRRQLSASPNVNGKTTGEQLRGLALDIDRCCSASPVLSIAHPILQNASDHLNAIARIHELQTRAASAVEA